MHPGVNLLPDANWHPGANCAHERGFRLNSTQVLTSTVISCTMRYSSVCHAFKLVHNADFLHYLLLFKFSQYNVAIPRDRSNARLFIILIEHILYEPLHNKTCLLNFRPGLTQTGLYNHRR